MILINGLYIKYWGRCVKLHLRKVFCYLPPAVVPVTCPIWHGLPMGAAFSLPQCWSWLAGDMQHQNTFWCWWVAWVLILVKVGSNKDGYVGSGRETPKTLDFSPEKSLLNCSGNSWLILPLVFGCWAVLLLHELLWWKSQFPFQKQKRIRPANLSRMITCLCTVNLHCRCGFLTSQGLEGRLFSTGIRQSPHPSLPVAHHLVPQALQLLWAVSAVF